MSPRLWDRLFIGLLASMTLCWCLILGYGVYLLIAALLRHHVLMGVSK